MMNRWFNLELGPLTINDVQLKATEHLNSSDIFTRPIQLNIDLKLLWPVINFLIGCIILGILF